MKLHDQGTMATHAATMQAMQHLQCKHVDRHCIPTQPLPNNAATMQPMQQPCSPPTVPQGSVRFCIAAVLLACMQNNHDNPAPTLSCINSIPNSTPTGFCMLTTECNAYSQCHPPAHFCTTVSPGDHHQQLYHQPHNHTTASHQASFTSSNSHATTDCSTSLCTPCIQGLNQHMTQLAC
jgi:hypothetical protein